MKRKKEGSAPSRIWTYGAPFGPTDHIEEVDGQIRLAHYYRNDLVTIGLAKRRAVIEVRDANPDDYAKFSRLDKKLRSAQSKLKTARREQKKGKRLAELAVTIAELESEISATKEERSKTASAQKMDQIQERYSSVRKSLRSQCGVYWGTYLLIEKAIDEAFVQAAKDKRELPEWRPYRGKGRMGVQIQQQVRLPNFLQLTKPNEKNHAIARLRIGSEGRNPVWATFPVVLHRPLPSDAATKWAWVRREKIGPRSRWYLQLSLESETFRFVPRGGNRVCAIDLGWRSRKEGDLRVGYLVDNQGYEEEILCPAHIKRKIEHTEKLRSSQAHMLNELMENLRKFRDKTGLPKWLRRKHRKIWVKPHAAKIARLHFDWRRNRFRGDANIFAEVDYFCKQSKHLWSWERSEYTKALLARREHYRIIATDLARKYSTIIMEELNLSELAERAKTTRANNEKKLREKKPREDLPKKARSNRFKVAPSEFREAIKLACSNQGAHFVLVPAAYTTMDCHVCSGKCKWDRKQLYHTCEHCGATWDQDQNAALNLLGEHRLSTAAE